MVDQLEIEVSGGDGGRGAVSFLRERFKRKGPPDGGDGGDGGDVYLVGEGNLLTLYDLKARRFYKAGNGGNGGRRSQKGKRGGDLLIRVPLGTEVRALAGKKKVWLGDLTRPGQKILVAKGGRGGRGNARFKSSTNRSPKFAEEGEGGQKRRLLLDLKILADVGLVGLPNAGKSTLLNVLTGAGSRVGEYPFTTLNPHLGVLLLGEGRLVLADIPGLIAGAHKGKGLGDRFLRHIERTKLLLHLVAPEGRGSWVEKYRSVRRELGEYSGELLEKPEIVVVTKRDLLAGENLAEVRRFKKVMERLGRECYIVSSLTGEGLSDLVKGIGFWVQRLRGGEGEGAPGKREGDEETLEGSVTLEGSIATYRIEDLKNKRLIFNDKKDRPLKDRPF